MRAAIGLGMAAIVALSAIYAFSPRHTPPLAPTRLATDRMHFNALARAGSTLVAGGELGYIATSTDEGKSWRAAEIEPRRDAVITAIVFADDKLGMAVGHEGLILRTEDGGQRWKELHFDKDRGEPLMSIARLSPGRWVAVGAFGRALRSADDGKTWEPFEIPGVEDKHMNRIVRSADGKRWMIVGERGLLLVSDDDTQTWRVVPPFYNGSLYGIVERPDGGWVAYGMRGNAFRSDAAAERWEKAKIPAPISTLGHAHLSEGALLLVGQGGIVLKTTDGGANFTIVRAGGRAALTDIQLMPDGSWLLASDGGLIRHDPKKAVAAAPTASAAAPAPAAAPAASGAQQ
jgi:photosystem II stability/assembly factor-like uncharacterized protein